MRISIPGALCLHVSPEFAGDASPPEVVKAIREAAKYLIESAIEAGLEPAPLPVAPDPGLTVNLTFPAKLDLEIRKRARAAEVRDGEIARRYLQTALMRGTPVPVAADVFSDSRLTPYLIADGKEPNAPQVECFDSLADCLSGGAIGLVEAATGVGKTFAMIVAAADALRMSGGRAVIAVPTLQVLRQFVVQHDRLTKVRDDMPLRRAVIGKREFICVAELTAMIADGAVPVDPQPILEWINAGCPPVGDAALAVSHEDAPCNGLAASLQAISPDFPVDAVRLADRASVDDPGTVAYAAQFARDDDVEPQAEIIYCTHAMIGVDLRRRMRLSRQTTAGQNIVQKSDKRITLHRQKGLDGSSGKAIAEAIRERDAALAEIAASEDIGHLPLWQYLLIDEAHVFETNLASALSSHVSLVSHLRSIRDLNAKGVLSKAALDTATDVIERIRGLAHKANGDEIDLDDTDLPHVRAVAVALAQLANAISRVARRTSAQAGSREVAGLMASLKAESNALRDAANLGASTSSSMIARLRYSPVRAYPQLVIGRRSIDTEMRFLWRTTLAAACVSATLYVRRLDADSSTYIRNVLSIPKERLREYRPIRPSWLYECVQGLWSPEALQRSGRLWLRPPSRQDRLSQEQFIAAESAWLDELTHAIATIRSDAAGGTLVLCTSYDMVRGIATRLGMNVMEKVAASPDTTIAQQLDQFVKYAREGRRPVWLALGAAWAGLDLNGNHYGIPNPKDDNLLTDLVIPRIPFGLNRSMTHQHRMEKLSSMPWELFDTAQRFKQGLGRLVRRRGLPKNRRIFVLDGRLNDPSFTGFLSLIRAMIQGYPHRKFAQPEP